MENQSVVPNSVVPNASLQAVPPQPPAQPPQPQEELVPKSELQKAYEKANQYQAQLREFAKLGDSPEVLAQKLAAYNQQMQRQEEIDKILAERVGALEADYQEKLQRANAEKQQLEYTTAVGYLYDAFANEFVGNGGIPNAAQYAFQDLLGSGLIQLGQNGEAIVVNPQTGTIATDDIGNPIPLGALVSAMQYDPNYQYMFQAPNNSVGSELGNSYPYGGRQVYAVQADNNGMIPNGILPEDILQGNVIVQ